jgi:aldehyde dehydrogenase (NAD+)
MTHYRDFHLQPIAGQWCRGAAGKNLLVSNPFDGALLQEIPQANCADLDAAYREAARVQPQWAALGPSARAAVLHQVVAVFDRRREEIIEWIIRESGSTRLKAQLEWGAARAIALESPPFLRGSMGALSSPMCRARRAGSIAAHWGWSASSVEN